MYLVLNPPGHHVTPVPTSEILVFDRSIMMRPPQFNLSGSRVFQILCKDPDARRVYAVNLHLSEALLTYQTTNVYPSGTYPDITEWTVHRSGQRVMYLVQDISRTLVLKVLRALYAHYDHDLGPPCKFVVSPSVHKKLITYEQWRVVHMGEMLGQTNIMLDSYRVYEWFLGCPMIGQVPFPLYNYFAGLAQAARL